MLPNLGDKPKTTGGYYAPSLPTLVRPHTPRGLVDIGGYYNPSAGAGMAMHSPQNNTIGAGVNNPNEPAPMANQYNKVNLQPQGAAPKPKTWRDIGHEQVDSKLGAGWAENFSKTHGMSPLDFYTDQRNWFKYQADAAKDYGIDSKEFAQATIRATIEEGMKHAQEVQMWQEKHGNTAIPDEMWQHWYYLNRGMTGPDTPVVW